MTIQEKHVSTRSVTVSHRWITHTLRGICVCTLSTVITYVVKFIIAPGMACCSRRWGHRRCSLHTVGVDVSMCMGSIWTGWGLTVKLRPLGPQLRVCLDLRESLSRQLSVWPVAPDSSGAVTLDPVQGRQSWLPGFIWHCQWKDGEFKIYQWKDLQCNQLFPTDKRSCWQKKSLHSLTNLEWNDLFISLACSSPLAVLL